MRCKSRRPGTSRLLSWALALATAALAVPAAAQSGPQARLPTVQLRAGMHLIVAELAQTPAQQATGMMFRTTMGANEAMLFTDEQPSVRCFWMRNTLIPLAIAFLQDDGTVVNIAEMQPRSEDSHCSKAPVRHALEMNAGWFAKRGIKPGSRIVGGPFGN
jgi:uncharacterized protein